MEIIISIESQPVIDVHFAGKIFQLSTAAGTDLVAYKIQDGSYECPLPMLISAFVARTTGLFLDVGANNGVYSLIAAFARPDVRVMAFEPFPPVLDLLRENIQINELDDKITIMEFALSESKGLAPIYLPNQGHGLIETSASLQIDFIEGSEPAMSVRTCRLDDLEFDEPISVIKVDIEGFELEFLRGALKTIDRDRPIIFAEMLSGAARKFAEVTRHLSDLGYLAFRLRPDVAILAHWIIFDDSAWNYALIPKDKFPLFRKICTQHDIEILAPV